MVVVAECSHWKAIYYYWYGIILCQIVLVFALQSRMYIYIYIYIYIIIQNALEGNNITGMESDVLYLCQNVRTGMVLVSEKQNIAKRMKLVALL